MHRANDVEAADLATELEVTEQDVDEGGERESCPHVTSGAGQHQVRRVPQGGPEGDRDGRMVVDDPDADGAGSWLLGRPTPPLSPGGTLAGPASRCIPGVPASAHCVR
jgi:hypothetical protein